jgi:hypothetical protein
MPNRRVVPAPSSEPTSVRCDWCGYKVRTRIGTGKPGIHRLYAGGKRYLCPGSPEFPWGDDIADWLPNPYIAPAAGVSS